MDLFPNLKSCRAGQAKPGDLVYAPGRSGALVCIKTALADSDGDPALLVLGPLAAGEFPYIDTNAEGFEVLVVGEPWRIVLSSKPADFFLDRQPGQTDLVGAICLHKNKAYVQASPKSPTPQKGQALAIFAFETSMTQMGRSARLPNALALCSFWEISAGPINVARTIVSVKAGSV